VEAVQTETGRKTMKPKGTRELCGRITVDEVKKLQSALKAAQLERCGCSDEAKEEFRLYLGSWVIKPIERVLQGLERRHKRSKPVDEADKQSDN
jgi:hypothetical protein